MDDQNEFGRSNWPQVKLVCERCGVVSYKGVPPLMPPEMGKICVCMGCLTTYIWWNEGWWKIEKVGEPTG
jgi:hypothetical protein